MSTKKRPGIIYELKDGRHAIAYHDEQKQEFRDLKKLCVHIYNPDDIDDQPLPGSVLKHVDTIKARIGFID